MDSPATPALVRRIAAGVAAGFTSAAVTHFLCLFVFFLASAANPEAFRQLNDYFLPSSLLLFVLLSLIAVFDGLRRWYIAIPAALVAAVLAAFAGTTIALGATGVVLDAVALEFVARSLAGPNLAFIIFATLVTATVGRRVWSLIAGGKLDSPRIRDRRVALVRLPAGNLADGIVTHQARVGIDTDLADRQWDEYVSALDEHGWDTVEVPVAPDAADSVFVEDTVVMFGELAVVTSPGADTRRGETAAVEETVRELGLRVERIELPGTLEGGDVLKVGTTVYVGRSGRTNAEGIRQLRALVSHLGYTVVAVPVSKVLHLKTAVTALPDGTVIGYAPNVDDPNAFGRFLAVPEETGSAVIVLDESTVLMAASAPQSAELIRDLGYKVVTVDISEFEKLEGCVTCLSVRVR